MGFIVAAIAIVLFIIVLKKFVFLANFLLKTQSGYGFQDYSEY